MLYNQIQDLQNSSKFTIHRNLCGLLKAERIKNRFNLKHQNDLLTPTLKEAANNCLTTRILPSVPVTRPIFTLY